MRRDHPRVCEVRCKGENRYGSTSTAALLQGNSKQTEVSRRRYSPGCTEARPPGRGPTPLHRRGEEAAGTPRPLPCRATEASCSARAGGGSSRLGSGRPAAERAGPGAALRRRARPRAVPTSLLSATGTHLNIRREVSPTVTHFFSLRGHSR